MDVVNALISEEVAETSQIFLHSTHVLPKIDAIEHVFNGANSNSETDKYY
jgi:hypothetical protein